jgi:hypothetical protein
MKKKILMLIIAATLGLTVKTMAQVPNYVPTNGLVGYWPFNGNANDESGNGNNGTVNGASLSTDRFGSVNKAYSFDGVDDYINLNKTLPSQFSISFWALVTTYKTYIAPGQNIIGSQIIGNFNNNYGISGFGCGLSGVQSQYGTHGCAFWNSTGNPNINSSNILALNSWRQIVCTYDGSILKYYDSNQLVGSVNGNYTQNQSNLTVGARLFHINGPDFFLDGKVDDIGLWNRALSQQEITDLYNPANAALPINILQFTGKRVENTNVLKWTTLSEQNNAYFEIEHSKDARNFTVVSDKINSKANNGNSNTALEYSFADVIPNEGHNYYRLKQTDKDGKTSMEKNVVDLYFGNETIFTLFPNPAHNVINVNADHKLIGKFYTIYDNIGKVVKSGKLNAANTSIELSNLSSGFYMFSVGENRKQSFKIIKE